MTSTTPSTGIAGWSVLVTGGGSGIGLATAERFAADGAHVTICGRTEQKLLEARERIAAVASGGAKVQSVVADVTVEEQVATAVAAAAEVTGRIDGLFACAGGSLHLGSVLTADIDAVRATIDLNLTGSVICVKQGGLAMQAQGGPGSMVLMSSGAGRFPHPHLWAYGVSKAGICFLAETAAEELGPLGIRVNAVAPGAILGGGVRGWIEGNAARNGVTYEEQLAAQTHEMALRRIATEDEVANAVLFLASEFASGITGANIDVNAGQLFG
jgi:NAD(P)-dependent dehydrogenase (short-subunit alcohol dehydrogenase family)